MKKLFEAIVANPPVALSKFIKEGKTTACIYPTPFDKAETIWWFYCCSSHNQVFFACSKEVSDKMDEDSWADVSDEFTVWIEHQVMPFCVENTDWQSCHRYMVEYDKKAYVRDKGRFTGDFDMGCDGTQCYCEPFGAGTGMTYGMAEEGEFTL